MTPVWIDSFFEQPNVRRLRDVLTSVIAKPIWWTVAGDVPKSLDYSKACRTCDFVRSSRGRQVCQVRFLKALEVSRRTKEPHQFLCPIRLHAVCFPLRQGDQTQGYLALCHGERPLSPEIQNLAALAAESSLQEMGRSIELKNLSEAIQPRCVALSTIHTIHRLISSTLDLKELLPRVARLCCQVLRGESCAIWLIDRDKRKLIPRAFVNIHNKNQNKFVRATRLGSGLIGQAAQKCQFRLMEKIMIVPLVEEECVGVIMVRRSRQSQPFVNLDQEILTTLAEQAVVAIRNAQMYETQERVTWGTIRSLSAILDGMDVHSPKGTSSRRQLMADIAMAIADRMGLGSDLQRPLQYAAFLHDAGRVGIPEDIIRKPSKLNSKEFAMVKEHTVKGARLLEPLEILEPAVPIILHHHERYDGTGYPKGLKGDAIPLGARILAVANAFEAMVSERSYRRSLSVAEAAREISSYAGTQFDPKVVKVFTSLAKEKKLDEIVRRNLLADSGQGQGKGRT